MSGNKTDETGKTGDVMPSLFDDTRHEGEQDREQRREGEEKVHVGEDVPELVKTAVATKALYEKYIAFHSDHAVAQAGTMTLFTLYTHVYDDFSFAPIVLVTAATSEAGKSKLFDVAELVVRVPFVVIDPSGPSLRNVIDAMHPTVMIDEADLLRHSKDMRAILNGGIEKGKLITRAAGRNGIVTYDPFGPKMAAGIHGEEPPLKGATLSRCIQIQLRRAGKEEEVADFNKDDAMAEAIPVAAAIKLWALRTDHDALRRARPVMPAELTDRQRDAWRPLVVVADLISWQWGQAARRWAVELSRAIPVTPDLMVQVLKDVYRIVEAREEPRIKSAQLAADRNALTDREYDDDLTPVQLSKRLARFGIRPDPVKWYEGKQQVRGFVYRNASGEWMPEWADVIGRYRLRESPDLS